MTVTLVAMAHAGELLITRDSDGLLRRHDQLRRGESLIISESEAEAAIARYDLDRVSISYPDYHTLADAVHERVPRLEVSLQGFSVSPTAVRLLLPELRAWAVDPGRRAAAWAAGLRLLADPVIKMDPELLAGITSAMIEVPNAGDDGYILGEVSVRQGTMLSYFDTLDQAA